MFGTQCEKVATTKIAQRVEHASVVFVGIPIALGYIVVGFTLGIAARNAGFTPFMGFITSFFNNASAGEYAAFVLASSDASYIEMAIMTLIANARYLLMACVISQRLAPDASLLQRVLIGFDLTDEIFGITAARYVTRAVEPAYVYGAMLVALPAWSGGTAMGVIAGSILPPYLVSALSVALYGMFIAIIIPPSKKDHIVGIFVLLSFGASFFAAHLPYIMTLSSGTRTIILTVVLSSAAAILFPIKDDNQQSDENKGIDTVTDADREMEARRP